MNKKTDFLDTRAGVILAAIGCNLLWGSAAPCIKLGYRLFSIGAADSMSQILFAGVRFTLAGLLTVIMGSLLRRRALLPKRGSGGMILLLALLQTVIQYTFFYLGLGRAPGFKGSISTPSSVFFAVLLASLVFRQEKLTPRKLLGCVLGFAGIVIINLNQAGGDKGFRFTGEGFLLLAAFSYACSTVFIRRFSQREDPVVLSGWQFTLGGSLMIAAALLFGGRLQPQMGAAWLLMGYLGFLSAAAYTLWSLLLQRHPVSRIMVFSFFNPVFGVFLSALLLGEGKELDLPRCLLALVLVCLGTLIVNSKGKAET